MNCTIFSHFTSQIYSFSLFHILKFISSSFLPLGLKNSIITNQKKLQITAKISFKTFQRFLHRSTKIASTEAVIIEPQHLFLKKIPDPVYPEIQITFIFKFRALNLWFIFKCDFNSLSCLAGTASDFLHLACRLP